MRRHVSWHCTVHVAELTSLAIGMAELSPYPLAVGAASFFVASAVWSWPSTSGDGGQDTSGATPDDGQEALVESSGTYASLLTTSEALVLTARLLAGVRAILFWTICVQFRPIIGENGAQFSVSYAMLRG